MSVGTLRDAAQAATADLQVVVTAVRAGGEFSSRSVLSNTENQLRCLRLMNREMQLDPPSRRVAPLGQVVVAVLPGLLTRISRLSAGRFEPEVARCRQSLSQLNDALKAFTEGRETVSTTRNGMS